MMTIIPQGAIDPVVTQYMKYWFNVTTPSPPPPPPTAIQPQFKNDDGSNTQCCVPNHRRCPSTTVTRRNKTSSHPIIEAARQSDEASVFMILLHESMFQHQNEPSPSSSSSSTSSSFVNATDTIDQRRTALHWACKNNNEEIVRLLLGHGANVNAIDSITKETPLHVACACCSSSTLNSTSNTTKSTTTLNIVRLLLDYDANVHMKCSNGKTPLHACARNGNVSIARLLLQHGANVDEKDSCGITPLCHSIIHDHLSVTKLLLDNDADVSTTDPNGDTPLDWAVSYYGEYDATLMPLLLCRQQQQAQVSRCAGATIRAEQDIVVRA